MTKDDYILQNLTEYQQLTFGLNFELTTRIPLAVERGQKARLFEEIASKYNVTVQHCRNIYYKKNK